MKQQYIEPDDPTEYPLDEEKIKIAEYVYNEYEEIRKDTGDLELDLLKLVNTETISGRFEMIFLATLFSGWHMKEERAFSIWESVTEKLHESNTDLYTHLRGISKKNVGQFAEKYSVPPKISGNIWETAWNLRRHDGDVNGLVQEGSWTRSLENIRSKCKGLNQKAFWVARVMRQKGAWEVPGQYCCVSDSHNKGFLKRTGFIKSEDDLFYNSRVMWKYFNEPFEHKYYDLPVFRFARSHGCSKCSLKICNLGELSSCI